MLFFKTNKPFLAVLSLIISLAGFNLLSAQEQTREMRAIKEALAKFQESLNWDPEYKPTSIYIDLIKHKILQEDVAEVVGRD